MGSLAIFDLQFCSHAESATLPHSPCFHICVILFYAGFFFFFPFLLLLFVLTRSFIVFLGIQIIYHKVHSS